ncbi:hypothetical protein LEMLEM_LOCUS9543, partial [Lemmus lemmus]
IIVGWWSWVPEEIRLSKSCDASRKAGPSNCLQVPALPEFLFRLPSMITVTEKSATVTPLANQNYYTYNNFLKIITEVS